MKNKDLWLSASTQKLFKSCSLKYYYSKILQIPEDTNQGALSGGIVHECLEYLLKPRRKSVVRKMIKSGELTNAVTYFLLKRCAKVGVSPEKFEDTKNMVLAALTLDFLCKGGKILGTEVEFKIENKEPYYKIKGYIDVLIKYGNKIVVRDYKSQSKIFSEQEIKENLQGYIYTLAAEHQYPDCQVDRVEFLMLKFLDEAPIQVFKANKKELEEFKTQLASVYKEMAEFSPENRFDNVAKFKDQPEDGSFGGKLLCGFGWKKGDLKKDGNLKYACPFKWGFNYFALREKNGTIVRTSLKKDELTKELGNGRFITNEYHKGCEAWSE